MSSSIQLDATTEALLDQLAQTQHRSRADIVREALQRLAQEQQTSKAHKPYDLVVDLIGIAQGGPVDLARNHKQAFQELLSHKQRR